MYITPPCFTDFKTFIETEIYTSECRRMQLRVFVKTKFSWGACPWNPWPNFAPAALVQNAFGVQICSKCISQILGLDPALP